MATMQRHDTLALAYIEITITGNLDKQHQSMVNGNKPSTGNLAQRRQAKLQCFGTKAAKQAPVFGTKATKQKPVLSTICIHKNTFTGSLLSFFLLSSNENLEPGD
jgi:hypothetical protein